MDLENLIKDTFTAHEHIAPDADEVLAATRGRLDRKRTVLTRPLAVAAGVVLLVLAAVTVVAVNRPEQQTPVAGAGGHTEPPVKGTVEKLAMPFSLGWLPPGAVDYQARRINIGTTDDPTKPVYGGEYMLDVKAGGQVLLVDVQEMSTMSLDDVTFKSGPGLAVTIGGRAGVESSRAGGPGGYELYLTRPHGGTMYVNVAPEPGSTASAQQLTSTGRRVAENLQFPGKTEVAPAFGLGVLPAGLHRCAFEVSRGDPGTGGPGASYSLGDCTAMPTIEVFSADSEMVLGDPGRPVQGHATRLHEDHGHHTVWILDAVHGAPIAVSGVVAPADLYAIADHLVLPR